MPSGSNAWWRDAVIYQVYPRSFADSDGDGLGDIPGILHRIDYLQNLGVDAIWISPSINHPYSMAATTLLTTVRWTLDWAPCPISRS